MSSSIASLETLSTLTTALASATLAVASIVALAVTRAQLKVTNEQRSDALSLERARVTLAYVEDFRRGKYQISTETIGQTLEITPDYAISLCGNLMTDDGFVQQIIVAGKNPQMRDLVLQVASVAYNFCQQTAILIWRGRVDQTLLLDLLSAPILRAAASLERLAETQPDLRSRLDTIPFKLLIALARERTS